jgi:hypothetical protein
MSSAAPLPSSPPIRLLDLAREIRAAFADRDALRDEIAAYLRSPASAPRLTALGRALLIDPVDLRELLQNAAPLLALAWGDALEMHGKRVPAQVTLSGTIAPALSAGGFVEATVEGDASGELRDGMVRWDPKALAAIAVRLEGGVDVRAQMRDDAGRGTHAASLQPAASMALENILLVPRATPAIGAVTTAVDGFVLPWDIPARFRASGGAAALAGRIVGIGGARSISIGGRFRWARALLSLPGDAAPVSIGVGVTAAARFSARVEGDFQIVIEARDERRVAVSVSRRRTTDSRVVASATAFLGLDRADAMARRAIEHLSGDAGRILASIEEDSERWSDLRALFHAAAEEKIDRILEDAELTSQIEAWLRAVSIDVDLRRRVRRVTAELLGEAAATAIDRIESAAGPAVDAIVGLIPPLRRALATLRGALDAAARTRIEIGLARSTSRSDAREIAFTFVLDPVASESLFLDMLRGEFTLAFRLAETGVGDVQLEQGGYGRSGTLEVESSLTIAALGREIGTRTVLTQEWDAEVAATGEVLIGVRTEIESEKRRWRSFRAARVLIESSLLAETDDAGRLVRRDGNDLMTVESEIEFDPSEEELREFEHRMIELGAIAARTSMTRDLMLERKRLARRPYGRLEAVAVLQLSWEDLDAIASVEPGRARATFANHLFRWAPPPSIPGILGEGGLPLFAWPSVLRWAEEGWPDATQMTRFHDAAANRHADVPAGHPARALYLYARTVQFFDRALGHLRAMRAVPADALDLERTARFLRREHRTLVRELSLVVGFVDSAIGEVLFSTMLDLLPPASRADAHLVVRREDGRRFVYS